MKLVIYIQILNAIPLSETLLNDQQKFELNKINEITYYFVAEIKQKELMSKRLSKYITSFDYFAKPLLFYLYQVVAFLLIHLHMLLENLYE